MSAWLGAVQGSGEALMSLSAGGLIAAAASRAALAPRTRSAWALVCVAWVALSVSPAAASSTAPFHSAPYILGGRAGRAACGDAGVLRLRGGKPINGKKPKAKPLTGGAAKAAAKSNAKAPPPAKKEEGAKAVVRAEGEGGQIEMRAMKKALKGLVEGEPTVTGHLLTHEGSQDIKIGSFSLEIYSKILVEDTTLELNMGRRYGLLGSNGSGKSTMLRALAAGLLPIPPHIDIFMLSHECAPSNMTALETVVQGARKEAHRLEELAEKMVEESGPNAPGLSDIFEKLDSMQPEMFEQRAGHLLSGLGFTGPFLAKATKDLSGGWRMRVSLCEALFRRPALLLLDEPTNHLDLQSVVWLEEHLATYDKILVVTSHSQDFLNGVCTNIIELKRKSLHYWGGNYDTFVKTKTEQETAQMKLYNKQQEVIAHTKEFIASCGTYSNLVKQAKSRQKQLDKMEEAGLIEPVHTEKAITIVFPECGKLVPPVIAFADVAFSYSGLKKDYLYTKMCLGLDSDSRVALVGPNGAGKSTLVKLMCGNLQACEGTIQLRNGMRLGIFSQHSAEQLDLNLSPIEYMQKRFPGRFKDFEDWRRAVGRFGITGEQQMMPIRQMSDGQKRRVVWTELWMLGPHMLLLDEPTNHLDMETIDALAQGIKGFEGGMLLVSHDFRLIDQVAKEVWVCDKGGVRPWQGDIRDYKNSLKLKGTDAMKPSNP